MIFRKKNNPAKKFDKLVTTVIIWWAVAGVMWLSKTKKWKRLTRKVFDWWVSVAKWGYSIFWKSMVKVLNLFSKNK